MKTVEFLCKGTYLLKQAQIGSLCVVDSVCFGRTLLRTDTRSIRNLYTKNYSWKPFFNVAVLLPIYRDPRRAKEKRDDSRMPASEIVKFGRDSKWQS